MVAVIQDDDSAVTIVYDLEAKDLDAFYLRCEAKELFVAALLQVSEGQLTYLGSCVEAKPAREWLAIPVH